MKKNNIIKKITVFLFLFSIFIVPTIMITTEDKDVNEIENKILQKFPRFNYENIKSGRFMSQFDTYVSDQFPLRNMFLYAKNGLNYALGQREFRNIYVTSSGKLLEKYTENKDVLSANIEFINNSVKDIDVKSTLFLVPNSISIYKDELPKYFLTDNQEDSYKFISEKLDMNLYSPLNVLKKHKNEYIYFNTDHHWTQLGAKIAFEDFFNQKINSDYTLLSDNFFGTYYSKAMLNNINADKIYCYKDLGQFENVLDGLHSNSLYNSSKLESKNKYQYFLNGDPAEGIIHGDGKGSILIIKDSFAHNFLPFLAKIYKTIHIIDPRYSNTSITNYIETNKDIDEVLFLLSLSTINSDYLQRR